MFGKIKKVVNVKKLLKKSEDERNKRIMRNQIDYTEQEIYNAVLDEIGLNGVQVDEEGNAIGNIDQLIKMYEMLDQGKGEELMKALKGGSKRKGRKTKAEKETEKDLDMTLQMISMYKQFTDVLRDLLTSTMQNQIETMKLMNNLLSDMNRQQFEEMKQRLQGMKEIMELKEEIESITRKKKRQQLLDSLLDMIVNSGSSSATTSKEVKKPNVKIENKPDEESE